MKRKDLHYQKITIVVIILVINVQVKKIINVQSVKLIEIYISNHKIKHIVVINLVLNVKVQMITNVPNVILSIILLILMTEKVTGNNIRRTVVIKLVILVMGLNLINAQLVKKPILFLSSNKNIY